MLTVIETHPIQYHAPVYRTLQGQFGVPVTVVYGSDFSISGYHDGEFDTTLAWDTDLLSGYSSIFLGRSSEGGARSAQEASTRGLAAALRQIAPTAVLLVGYSPRFHQYAYLEAWNTRKPLLLRAETTDHALRRAGPKSWLRDGALRWMYARCARLLYVGERSKQHFRRLGCPERKLVFSPYCVDAAAFEPDELARERLRQTTRRALGILPVQRVLLLSGKLVPRKRPDLVLRAAKQLPAERRELIHIVALGSGPELPALERLAGEWPPVKFTCVGFQNQTRLSAFYHAADLLVLPSTSRETWGLVVNEALHHGLPCVVSEAVGSAPDLVDPGQTGEVFETDSAASLNAALERAWPLMEQARVRDKCRRLISRYTVEQAAEGIARAYAEAVANGT